MLLLESRPLHKKHETFQLEHELLLLETATLSNFSDEVLSVTTLRIDDEGDSTIYRCYFSNINIVGNDRSQFKNL